MKMIVRYEGVEYVSQDTDEMSAEDAAEQCYQFAEDTSKLRMILEDGGFLVLPKEAAQRCVVIFRD